MSLTGYATLEATTRYRDRFDRQVTEDHFRNENDLRLSSIGIGTYLGNADEATDARYEDSVLRAVQLGVNVIDTAANYRFQRSERSIGRALKVLTQEHGFSREEILICTKGGYLPFDGAPPRDVRAYIEETFVKPGIARFEDFAGGSHCMTPSYLENQLEQSLENMKIDCIDVYYVHNPESQLAVVREDEFYERLRAAFEFLETRRAESKIRNYGIASWNGFRVPSNSPQHHPLSRVIKLARDVGGESHGFRFIQLPFNLAMPEALTVHNELLDGEAVSVLEAAARFDVAVVSSASILQGRVAFNLPESVREPLGRLSTDAQTAIQFVRSAPGITTALVGMSRREHVEENLQLARLPLVGPDDFMRLFTNT